MPRQKNRISRCPCAAPNCCSLESVGTLFAAGNIFANHRAHFLGAVSIKLLFVPVEGTGCAIDNEDVARFLGSGPVVGRQGLEGNDRHVRGDGFVENLESRRVKDIRVVI